MTPARLVTAPAERVPIQLYTSILPPLVIHAQLDTASSDAYAILHLIMSLPLTITVRTPFMTNVPAVQFSIVRSPFTASTFLLPFTAYRSISAIDHTDHPVIPTITGRVTLVVPVVLFNVVDVLPFVNVMKSANRFPGLMND